VRHVTLFIAREHAMHAECDIVLPILSICPSIAGVMSKRMDILSQFFNGLVGISL